MNFNDYIQELLGNPNPKGNMLTGVSTTPNFYNQAQNNDYYNNPFRRQDSIDAAMAKKLADEQALARQLGIPTTTGMLGGGSDSGENSLDPATLAYLNAENSTERGARNNAFFDGNFGAMGLDAQGMPTPGRMAQMAYQYQNTPSWLQPMLPNSYANAAGFINQADSIFGGMNPNGTVSMGAQQAAALAAQDAGLFDTPAERAAWYADNAHNNFVGGFTNSEGNAPGATPGEVGDASFSGDVGDVGYDQ